MKIARDNYEPFFLDYLEGNLEENLIDQFLDFLNQNPDLKEELNLFENIHLPEEQVVFKGKEHLYKAENDSSFAFERKAVAFMEGDLPNEERNSFEAYLAVHPELQKEYSLFTKTRLIADAGIKYPQKQKLYRKSGMPVMLNWVARAAAVVVLLWGISSLFPTENQKPGPKAVPEIASVKISPASPAKNVSPEKKILETEITEKPAAKIIKESSDVQEYIANHKEQLPTERVISPERDQTGYREIAPIFAMLEAEPMSTQLAVGYAVKAGKINDQQNTMTIDQFLASRAKKVTNEGLLSAQRFLRAGLNVASELSGEHIGYKVENGKVASIGFESKLLAFSIPLKKK